MKKFKSEDVVKILRDEKSTVIILIDRKLVIDDPLAVVYNDMFSTNDNYRNELLLSSKVKEIKNPKKHESNNKKDSRNKRSTRNVKSD